MWLFYALLFAIFSSISVIIAKKVMQEINELPYLLFCSLFTFPFLFFISLYFFGIPRLDFTFWVITIFSTLISVGASLLAYHAIRISEISLVNPISSFNPVFTAIISYFTLGEEVSSRGVIGILLVVFGAYLLQISKVKKSFFAPITALIKHRGVQLSFIAYFIWSITPTFEKTAIFHTYPNNPPFAALMGQLVAIIIFLIIISNSKSLKKSLVVAGKLWKVFLLIGLISSVSIASAFIAYSLNSLGITTAIFKLSIVFVPLLGWIFLKEKSVKERLPGIFVMLIGVIFLLYK